MTKKHHELAILAAVTMASMATVRVRSFSVLVVLLCVLCFLCFYRSLCTFSVFFMSNVCIVRLLYMGLVA